MTASAAELAEDAMEPTDDKEPRCAFMQGMIRIKRFQEFGTRWSVKYAPLAQPGTLTYGARRLLEEGWVEFDKLLPDVAITAKRTIKRFMISSYRADEKIVLPLEHCSTVASQWLQLDYWE